MVRAPQAIHIDQLLRAIAMAHELVAHLNESHKALLHPQSYPYYYHPGPGFPHEQHQHPDPRMPPNHAPQTQPLPSQVRHVAPPAQGSGPQHTTTRFANQTTSSPDQRQTIPPAPAWARPPHPPFKVSDSAAGVLGKDMSAATKDARTEDARTEDTRTEDSRNEGARNIDSRNEEARDEEARNKEVQNENVRKERPEEPESHREQASQQDVTDVLREPSEVDRTVRSKPDNDTSADDPSSTPGEGDDGDVTMTQGDDDENAKQKDTAQVITADEESGESSQGDSAMSENSNHKDGSVGGDKQDEVGDTVMADAPVKEGPTREADEARAESGEV